MGSIYREYGLDAPHGCIGRFSILHPKLYTLGLNPQTPKPQPINRYTRSPKPLNPKPRKMPLVDYCCNFGDGGSPV